MARTKDENLLVEDAEMDSSEARVYELGFHLDPELPVEEVKKSYEAIRQLTSKNSTIVAEVAPEKIKLAYTISRQEVDGRRDFNSAYFGWIVYETNSATHSEIISTVSTNKSVIRFIDLVTNKEQARHALEVHELMVKVPEETESSPEEVLNTELDAALEGATL